MNDPRSLVPAVLRPVRKGNTFEETIERLLQIIHLGTVLVGEKLPPERDLADQLGVSRATLREALSELQAAGFVEVRRGRYGGTYVASTTGNLRSPDRALSADEVDDVLRFRAVLEVEAARLAARAVHTSRVATSGSLARLRAALKETHDAPYDAYRPLDSRLHLVLAELSGIPSLTRAIADSRNRINGLLDRIPLLKVNLVNSQDQHQALVEAVALGQEGRAAVLMAEHLDGTELLLRGFLTDT